MFPTRPSSLRVARRFLNSSVNKVRLTGPSREAYLDEVWDMYKAIYSRIGMHIQSPRGLLNYDIWDVTLHDGKPVAFSLYSKTKYGLKSGLSGHDGSGQGRSAAIKSLRTKFRQPGVYGEVSHKVKDIALASGAPVICAAYAEKVLNKPIELDEDDPLSYYRTLSGIGKVKKTLVGHPRGVPTTDPRNPQCPIQKPTLNQKRPFLASSDDQEDAFIHAAEHILLASLFHP